MTVIEDKDGSLDVGADDLPHTNKEKGYVLEAPGRSADDAPIDDPALPPSPSPTPPVGEPAVIDNGTNDPEGQRAPDIYDRFSPKRKRLIVAIVSYAAFIGPISSSAFLPSIGVMATELHTSPAMINYTVAIFVVSIGIAPLVWSPLSGFYGRKPVYLMSMPIMTVASVGVANSHSIGAVIATRILQGIGSSCVLSVGAGTVGDIYRPTERANAMAWFYSGVLLGPALSPVLAGVFTEYTSITWRATQYFLCAASALAVVLTALFLPETSHPPLPHDVLKKERGKKFVLYVFNPLTSLGLLRYVNIVTTTIASCCIMLMTYCIMVPMSVIFQERYHISNVAIAGCVYLSTGVGTLIGSRTGGPLADRAVRIYIKKRGYRRPEDRLHAALWGAGLIAPASCLVYGWLLQANKGGMAPPLIMLVINGLGMQLAITPVNTYLVDSAQRRSAEAIAVNNFWRYMFSAAGSAFVLPMIDAIGLGWTMTFAAAMGWLAFLCIVITMKKGEGWRTAAKERIEKQRGSTGASDEDKEMAPPEKSSPTATTTVGDDLAIADDELETKERKHSTMADTIEKIKHLTHSRRHSTASAISDHDHGEAEHGEPTHLPPIMRGRANTRTRRGSASATGALQRERSRRGSTSTLPSVGEVLQRTVSLSGASVHGGG